MAGLPARWVYGRMRRAPFALSLCLLACQGCVSLAFSRFQPESDGHRGDTAECREIPPLADGVMAVLLGIGARSLDGAECAVSDGGSCGTHFKFHVPALLAGASAAYGTVAWLVCSSRLTQARGEASSSSHEGVFAAPVGLPAAGRPSSLDGFRPELPLPPAPAR